MIYLASSSKIRAKLLQDANINFKQISVDYDETNIKEDNPSLYVQKVALKKQEQFFKIHKDYENVLFADTIVNLNNLILTKAKSDEEALKMLNLQSQNQVKIITMMIFVSKNKILQALSSTILFFDKFEEDDIKNYINSKLYKDKAGAIMCEGFHKKYIKKQIGHTSTALGLNIELLKAYL